MATDFDKKMMRLAITLSKRSVATGGGPFGAVIVKDDQIVSRASNSVTKTNDPTAHAEVNAIRKACRKLGTFDLSGCVLYTSCKPCPMCLGAIYWAHIDKYFFGNDAKDAARIGFDDNFIYEELALSPESRRVPSQKLLSEEAIEAFEMWEVKTDKTEY